MILLPTLRVRGRLLRESRVDQSIRNVAGIDGDDNRCETPRYAYAGSWELDTFRISHDMGKGSNAVAAIRD